MSKFRELIGSSYYNLLYLITLIIAICCNYKAIKSQNYLKYGIIFIVILNLISTVIKMTDTDINNNQNQLITSLIHLLISILIIIFYWSSLKYSLIIVLLLPLFILFRLIQLIGALFMM